MDPASRAKSALARPNHWLDRVGEVWLVRVGADRRRRPLLRLDAAQVQSVRREPGLLPRAEGGWWLAGAGMEAAPGRWLDRQRRVGPEGRNVQVSVNRGESPIAWLARRKGSDGQPFLSGLEITAAERLREDFEAAAMTGRVTMDWTALPRDRTPRSPGSVPPANLARRRVRQALRAVGPGLSEILEEVCLNGSALQAAERALGLPSRTGKVRLKLALERLARHYRMA